MHCPNTLLFAGLVVGTLAAQDWQPAIAAPQAPDSRNASQDAERCVVSQTSGLHANSNGPGLVGGGESYAVAIVDGALRFEPGLGPVVPQTQHLTLQATGVRRGGEQVVWPQATAPRVAEHMAVIEHGPGIHERFDVRPEGVELSWRFEQPLPGSGDLTVCYAINSSLGAPMPDGKGGLQFVQKGIGGVSIGGVTGIDARGHRTAGGLQCQNGQLELSLPAAFVAAATYPLVLDPIVGTTFLAGSTSPEAEPDVCFDTNTNTYLVVWEWRVAGNDVRIRGQRVLAGTGALTGGLITFGSSGIASRPKVANLRMKNRFGVVWTQMVGSTSSARFQDVAAGTGVITNSLNLASSTTATYSDVGIAGEGSTQPGTLFDFLVVYHDQGAGAIRKRRLYYDAADNFAFGSLGSIWTNNTSLQHFYAEPSICRASGPGGKVLVVVRQTSGLSAVPSIESCVLSIDGTTVGPFQVVMPGNSGVNLLLPAVDGLDSLWVVAFVGVQGFPGYYTVTVDYDAATNNAGAGLSSFVSTGSIAPSVAFTPARSWVCFRTPIAGQDQTLHVDGVDSATGTFCDVLIVDTIPASVVPSMPSWRVAVATGVSSGSATNDNAMAVWTGYSLSPLFTVLPRIYAQRLISRGTGGTIANLLGACGNGGTMTFNQSPAIGSNGFTCSVSGLAPTALLAVFNFAPPGPPFVCGTCVFTPWSITLTPPIVANTASVTFPIPCRTNLVGAQFETQWTTIDLTQNQCPILSGFVTSNRALLTLGQ